MLGLKVRFVKMLMPEYSWLQWSERRGSTKEIDDVSKCMHRV